MNIKIESYISFSGPVSELDPIVADIAAALVAHGYGVDPENDVLTSLVVVKESEIYEYDNPQDFVKLVATNPILVVVPIKEEE